MSARARAALAAVSPAKTWTGVAGGLVLSALTACLLAACLACAGGEASAATVSTAARAAARAAAATDEAIADAQKGVRPADEPERGAALQGRTADALYAVRRAAEELGPAA